MYYFEVFIADARYRGDRPLTYSYGAPLKELSIVTIPLKQRLVTGFIVAKVKKPGFIVKPIKAVISEQTLPAHSLKLANWLANYYASSPGEALKQFAPSKPAARLASRTEHQLISSGWIPQLQLEAVLTDEQKQAIDFIDQSPSQTVLLHGDTGTGKTRVYIELSKKVLTQGKSVLLLTPEISLTGQLAFQVEKQLHAPVFIFHSQLTVAKRRQIWLKILESSQPVVIIGPRSALFSPIKRLGLIVLDEANEPSYKQDQSPRYHAVRVASQLGLLTGAKVVLGTATPNVEDYYLAESRQAIARMQSLPLSDKPEIMTQIIDIKDRTNFTRDKNISNAMLDAIAETLAANKQVMVYLNRRGSARLILCNQCGWQMLCPNCDIPLIYHGDIHKIRCHICGYNQPPPSQCPSCSNINIIYRSVGTKAIAESLKKQFSPYNLQRFDSDNVAGERINEVYDQLLKGRVNIIVGTQLLAKGFDLPRLGLVGVISAEDSLSLPDYTAEERSFHLLYQVIGRVGRGHGKGVAVIQSYHPQSPVLTSAINRDYLNFYHYVLASRQQFRFPPYSYLLKLMVRKVNSKTAETAAVKLKAEITKLGLPVEIIGPAPRFYARRGRYYYWQLIIKSKQRQPLQQIAKAVPAGWIIDIDPVSLL